MGASFWIMVVVGGFIGLMALLFLMVFGSSLAIALLNKNELPRLTLAQDQVEHKSAKARAQIDEAKQLGMLRVGGFMSDRPDMQDQPCLTMLLSKDGCVLAIISAEASAVGYGFYSRMPGDHWLETEQNASSASLSPYFQVKRLGGVEMHQLLRYHLDRVEDEPHPAVPFEPESLIDDLIRQEQLHAEYLVDQGLARWTDPQRTAWRMTLRGAFKQAWLLSREPYDKENLELIRHYTSRS